MSDTSDVGLGIFQTYGDKERLQGYLSKYKKRSEDAEAARSTARTQMQDATTRNLQAIDQLTADIQKSREGRWNLPALAFSAGMLAPPPMEGSNFGTELSRGFSNMIPAIQKQRMDDDEFYRRLGDLKAARATAEMGPIKSDLDYAQKQAENADRQSATLEAADIRTLSTTDKMRLQGEKNWAAVLKQADTMFDKMSKNKEKASDGKDLTYEEENLLRKLAQREAIAQNNAGLDPKSPNFIDPSKVMMSDAEMDQARRLRSDMVDKPSTADERAYKDYVRESQAKQQQALSFEDWKINRAAQQKGEVGLAEETMKTKMAYPKAKVDFDRLTEHLDRLITMPGLYKAVGPVQGKYPAGVTLGKDANDFLRAWEAVQSGMFLASVKSMQGLGALSNAEGDKLAAAMESLSRSQTPESFIEAVKRLKQQVAQMDAAMQKQMDPNYIRSQGVTSGGPPGATRAGTTPDGKTVWRMPDGSMVVGK